MMIRLMILMAFNGIPPNITPQNGPKYLRNIRGFFASRSSWNSVPHPEWKGMIFFVIASPVHIKHNDTMVDIGNFHIGTIEMGCLISFI